MSRILVVEDDPVNIELIKRFLALYGHEAVVTGDGEEAIRIASSEGPRLILMDGSLDESAIDGWETTRRLKANPNTKKIPVIAVTASAMASERDRALSAGCDDFAQKPFDFGALISKINAHLKDH